GDGKMLASGGRWTMKLWDAATGKEKATLRDGSGFIQTVALSSDGKTLASSVGSTTKLWDVSTGKEKATLAPLGADTGIVKSVAFSGDGKLLASAGYSKTIWLWDVATQEAVQIKRDEQQRLAHEAMAKKDKEKVNQRAHCPVGEGNRSGGQAEGHAQGAYRQSLLRGVQQRWQDAGLSE